MILSVISVSQQRSSASCSQALEAVCSVREHLVGGSSHWGAAGKFHVAHLHLLGEELTQPSPSNGVWRCSVWLTNCLRVFKRGTNRSRAWPQNLCHFALVKRFREIILSYFPKLRDSGGFDLLRCQVAECKVAESCCWKWKSLWDPSRKIWMWVSIRKQYHHVK